jgi:hypothetical protein
MATTDGSEEALQEIKRRLRLKLLGVVGLWVLAVGASFLFISQRVGVFAAVGIGGLIFLSAAAVGAAFGFIFAVPRVLASQDASADPQAQKNSDETKPALTLKARLLGSNTNLERISDWLTTMLVGVGLTQLNEIDSALFKFRIFLAETARVFPAANCTAPPCPPPTAGSLPAVGPMLLVVGVVMGFLFLYLYTRLILVTLFHEVEAELGAGMIGRKPLNDREANAAVAQATDAQAAENPALKSLVTKSQPLVDDALSLMFNLLYRPNGYQAVIDLGGQLANTPATRKAEYWFYMAAAFGQKYKALKANGAPAADVGSARANALDCARRAVALDASFKSRLWSISNPAGPDDDLSELRDDPAFHAIVGMGAR